VPLSFVAKQEPRHRTSLERRAHDHSPRPAGEDGIGRPQEYTVEQVETALKATFGNLTAAAQALKCERSTVYVYLERYPHLKEIRPAKRRELVEIAEDHLFAAVKDGKQWAIERVLRTVGKDLGYGDNVEVSSPGAAVSVKTVIEFEFVEPTPRDDDGKTIDGKLA
jgi:hypothetical protein